MSKKEILGEDLETANAATEEKKAKAKKLQTPEDRAILEAGVNQMKEMGVSENLAKLLDLVPAWNDDKEALPVIKEQVIEAFEGSENLKNFVDADLDTDMMGFQGISKAMPVLNNIKSFYARRAKTARKPKNVQVSIGGVTYNVDSKYHTETADLPADERKELLLNHPATKKAELIEEIL